MTASPTRTLVHALALTVLFLAQNQLSARAGELSLSVSAEGKTAQVIIENRSSAKITVVAAREHQEKISKVTMSLRSGYRSFAGRSTDEAVPYLVIEIQLANKERMLVIEPVEAGELDTKTMLNWSQLYLFQPGEKFTRSLELPAAPREIAVGYVDSEDRQKMHVLRWRAHNDP